MYWRLVDCRMVAYVMDGFILIRVDQVIETFPRKDTSAKAATEDLFLKSCSGGLSQLEMGELFRENFKKFSPRNIELFLAETLEAKRFSLQLEILMCSFKIFKEFKSCSEILAGNSELFQKSNFTNLHKKF